MDTDPPSSNLTLSDGRQLAYIDYGANGLPASTPTILHFHGFPGSRIEGSIAATYTRELGARLIAADRPGMGLSTFQPNRKFLDWPKDVLELVDHLKIDRFYILGVSGGAPYVLACLHTIPKQRIMGAAIVSGAYPYHLGTKGMLLGPKILLWTASSTYLSGLVAPLLDWMLGKISRDYEHPERLEKQFMQEMSGRHEKDLRCLDDLVLRKQVIEAMREAFRQDSIGVTLEAGLYWSDWGFDLEELKFDELILWHGNLDVNAPVTMAEKAGHLLRGSKPRIVENESHLSLPVNHLREIVETLLGRKNT